MTKAKKVAKIKKRPTYLEYCAKLYRRPLKPVEAKSQLLYYLQSEPNLLILLFHIIAEAGRTGYPRAYLNKPDSEYNWIASYLRKAAPQLTAAQIKEIAQLKLEDLIMVLIHPKH